MKLNKRFENSRDKKYERYEKLYLTSSLIATGVSYKFYLAISYRISIIFDSTIESNLKITHANTDFNWTNAKDVYINFEDYK